LLLAVLSFLFFRVIHVSIFWLNLLFRFFNLTILRSNDFFLVGFGMLSFTQKGNRLLFILSNFSRSYYYFSSLFIFYHGLRGFWFLGLIGLGLVCDFFSFNRCLVRNDFFLDFFFRLIGILFLFFFNN